jgi:hypothetical protein
MLKLLSLRLTILLFVLSTGIVLAQDIEQIGSLADGTGSVMFTPKDIFVQGNYSYVVSSGSKSLHIIDVANPASPLDKATLFHGSGGAQLSGLSMSIAVNGNYAYIAQTSGLEVVDVTNPAAPVHAAYLADGADGAILTHPSDIFVLGNYAYITNGQSTNGALEIVDITVPTAPVHKGSISNGASGALLNNPRSVFVSGNFAYVASQGSNAVEIIDVSNPSAPAHYSSLVNGAGGAYLVNPHHITVSGSKAYVTAEESSNLGFLEIIDIATPAVPLHLGKFQTFPGAREVRISGNYAYFICAAGSTVQVVDITNATAPVQKSYFFLNGYYYTPLALSGNFIYAPTDATNTLSIVNISNPAALSLVSTYLNSGPRLSGAHTVRVIGNHAYVTSADAFNIIDISTPQSPTFAARLINGSGNAKLNVPRGFAISGSHAFIASKSSNALEVVDISNPLTPVHKSSLTMSSPTDLVVQGIYAYVVGGNALRIVDISDPSVPVQVGVITDGGSGGALLNSPASVFVAGSYAYIASSGSNALEVVDVSNKANPTHAGSIVHGNGGALLSAPASVYVSGNHAFIASQNSNALEIVDVSIPSAPSHKASLVHGSGGAQLNLPRHVWIDGQHAYVTSGYLSVIDVSNPATPVHKSSVPLGGTSAFINGDYAYVAGNPFRVLGLKPYVQSFTPLSGVVAATVQITGGRFDPVVSNNSITFNGVPAAIMSGSTTNLVTSVPAGATTGPIRITSRGLTTTATPDFQVVPNASITSANNGIYGSTINITINKGGSTGAITYSVENITGTATRSGTILTLTGAGMVKIKATIAADANYAPVTLEQVVTISKKQLTATSDKTVSYRGVISLTINYSGFVLNDNASMVDTAPTISCTALDIMNSGSYPDAGQYDIQILGGSDNNYNIVGVTGRLTILKLSVQARARSYSRPYGQDNPPFQIDYLDVWGNIDNTIVPTSPPTVTCSAGKTTTASTIPYAIEVSNFTQDKNYQITPINGGLTITKADQTVSRTTTALCAGTSLVLATPVLTISSGLPTTLSLIPTTLATLNGNELKGMYGGTVTISITNAGNVNYKPLNTSGTYTINYCFEPKIAGTITDGAGGFMRTPSEIVVQGNYAYVVSSFGNSLEVIDISNPLLPVHAGGLRDGMGGANLQSASNIAVSGDYVYITTTSGLEVVNISDPAHPIHTGYIADGSGGAILYLTRDVFVLGNYAYVTSAGTGALEIIDISNPSSPTHKGKLLHGAGGALLQSPTSVFVAGNYAFIASTGSNALEVVNVTNPASPVHAAALENGVGGAVLTGPKQVFVDNGKAYVLTSESERVLEIIDVSVPTTPVHVSTFSSASPGTTRSMSVAGNKVYITNDYYRLLTIDVSGTPTLQSTMNFTAGLPVSICVSGSYGYVAHSSTNVIEIFNITSAPPAYQSTYFTPGARLYNANAIELAGDYAYVTASDALEVVNVSNPQNLVHTARVINRNDGTYLKQLGKISVSNNFAYLLSTGTRTLEIFNVINPASPQHVASFSTGSTSNDTPGALAVKDGYAYVTTTNSLQIINVQTPASPSLSGKLMNGTGGAELFSSRDIVVSGNYAYIAVATNALEIVNVSDKANPVHAGVLTNGTGGAQIGTPISLFIRENLVYIASFSSNALEIVDVSTPTAPVHKGAIVHSSTGAYLTNASDVYVQGSFAYVSANSTLTIVDISNPATPVFKNSSSLNVGPLAVRDNYAYTVSMSSLRSIQLPPLISTFTPSSGTAGSSVVITGENFDPVAANNIVLFKDAPATVTASTSTSITVTVPPNATNGDIIVAVNSLAAKASPAFVVTPVLTFTSGNSGTYNQTVTLSVDKGLSTGEVLFSVESGTGSAVVTGSSMLLTGAGTVTVKATLPADANHGLATQEQQFTIHKVPQSISLSFGEITYGHAPITLPPTTNAGLPITYSALPAGVISVNGNTLTIIGAGQTMITATQSGDANYESASDSEAIDVKRPIVDVSVTGPFQREYGIANPTFLYQYDANDFVNNETATVMQQPLQFLSDATVSSPAGFYPIHPSLDNNQQPQVKYDGNYELRYNAAQFEITKVAVLVRADNKTRQYNEPNPELTLTYEGLRNGDAASVINPLPVVSTAATQSSPAGTYEINVSGGQAQNYNVTYQSGLLTIMQRAQTFSFNFNNSVCIDDVFALPNTSESGAPLSFSSSNTAVATVYHNNFQVRFTAAGTVTLTATAAGNSNYQPLNYSMTVTVNPKTALTTTNKTVCSGASVVLTASPTGGYWTGTYVSGNTFNATGVAAGYYTATYNYTNQYGCPSSALASVQVYAAPNITAFNAPYCISYNQPFTSSVTVSNSSGATYLWQYTSGWSRSSATVTGTSVTLKSVTTMEGFVKVTVTQSGCSVSRTRNTVDCIGVSRERTTDLETDFEPEVHYDGFYPNPADKSISIELETPLDNDAVVTLYSIQGVVMKTETMRKGEYKKVLNTEDVPAGVYVVRLVDNSRALKLTKIVISHEK